MDICEVFALNIQPSQLKSILSTDKHNLEGFEEARRDFLGWLKEQFSFGIRYNSQCDAWFWYKLFIDEPLEEEVEDWEPDWISRQKQILFEQAEKVGVNDVDVDNLYYSKVHGG